MIIDGFTYPGVAIIGIILMSLITVWVVWGRKQENFSQIELLQSVYRRSSTWYFVYIFCSFIISLGFILLLAGPYKENTHETLEQEGIDIELVVDVSYSMIADDIFPSRIDVAKSMLQKLIDQLETDRVGIILFSGKPFSSSPLTDDYDFLNELLESISVNTINQQIQKLQGTAIGDALILASDTLTYDAPDREKVIILITDGEANRGLDPKVALKLVKENDIKVYTIGVGGKGDTTIQLGGQSILVSGVDEAILKKISFETGGEYYRADSIESFDNIMNTISELEKRPLKTQVFSSQKPAILDIVIFMILSYFFISYTLVRKKIAL